MQYTVDIFVVLPSLQQKRYTLIILLIPTCSRHGRQVHFRGRNRTFRDAQSRDRDDNGGGCGCKPFLPNLSWADYEPSSRNLSIHRAYKPHAEGLRHDAARPCAPIRPGRSHYVAALILAIRPVLLRRPTATVSGNYAWLTVQLL